MVWGLLLVAWALGFGFLWALVYVGAGGDRLIAEPVRWSRRQSRRPRWARSTVP
jgi:hypothetical protein